jgi:tetratricopeptide (TPR) repeat protein
MRFVCQLLLVVAVLSPATVHAQANDEVDKARARYEQGRALYQIGRYDDAIREFNAGWDLSQKPRFLYNLALCYRKLGDLPKTRDYLRRYLSLAPDNDANRHSIEGQLADVEAELGTQPAGKSPAATTPSTSSPVEARPSLATPAPAASDQSPAGAQLTTTAPPHKSAKRHLAWAIPLSVAVAGVAIGLGVYYGTRGGCDASVGCIDAGR